MTDYTKQVGEPQGIKNVADMPAILQFTKYYVEHGQQLFKLAHNKNVSLVREKGLALSARLWDKVPPDSAKQGFRKQPQAVYAYRFKSYSTDQSKTPS